MQQGSPSLESFIIKSQTASSQTTLKKLSPDDFTEQIVQGIISKNRTEVCEIASLNLARVDQFTLVHPDLPVRDLASHCMFILPKLRSWFKILGKPRLGHVLVKRAG